MNRLAFLRRAAFAALACAFFDVPDYDVVIPLGSPASAGEGLWYYDMDVERWRAKLLEAGFGPHPPRAP